MYKFHSKSSSEKQSKFGRPRICPSYRVFCFWDTVQLHAPVQAFFTVFHCATERSTVGGQR